MYWADNPTNSYQDIANYFNKKWKMKIKSGSIWHIIYAGNRWLSTPNEDDDHASGILPSEDAQHIVSVNVDTSPVDPTEDNAEIATTPTQLNSETVTTAQTRQWLITVIKYVSRIRDIGKHHLENLQCLLIVIDNDCAGINKNNDSALKNIMDIGAKESFTGSDEVKVEEMTENCPDDRDNFTRFDSDGGTDKMGEVEVECDRKCVQNDSIPQQEINTKCKPLQHETEQVNSKDHMKKHSGLHEKLLLECDKCYRTFTHHTQLLRRNKQHTEVHTVQTFTNNDCSVKSDVVHKAMDVEQSLEEFSDSAETVNMEETSEIFFKTPDPVEDLSNRDIIGCDNTNVKAESCCLTGDVLVACDLPDVQDDSHSRSVQVIKAKNKRSQNESKLKSESEDSGLKMKRKHCDDHYANLDNMVSLLYSDSRKLYLVIICLISQKT